MCNLGLGIILALLFLLKAKVYPWATASPRKLAVLHRFCKRSKSIFEP
jgi:hypothetical protein